MSKPFTIQECLSLSVHSFKQMSGPFSYLELQLYDINVIRNVFMANSTLFIQSVPNVSFVLIQVMHPNKRYFLLALMWIPRPRMSPAIVVITRFPNGL